MTPEDTAQPMQPDNRCSIAGPDGTRIPTDDPHAYQSHKGANTIWVRTCAPCGAVDWDDLRVECSKLVTDARTQSKLDAIRALVAESTARMEPVSWIDALTEILDGGK